MRYPPLRYYLERVLRDMGGGISHWAAKSINRDCFFFSVFGPLRQLVRKRWDPDIKGLRSQQRSVTDHPPLSDCTKTQYHSPRKHYLPQYWTNMTAAGGIVVEGSTVQPCERFTILGMVFSPTQTCKAEKEKIERAYRKGAAILGALPKKIIFPTFRLSINFCVFDRVKLIETDYN